MSRTLVILKVISMALRMLLPLVFFPILTLTVALVNCDRVHRSTEIFFDPRSHNLPFPSDLLHTTEIISYSAGGVSETVVDPRLEPERASVYDRMRGESGEGDPMKGRLAGAAPGLGLLLACGALDARGAAPHAEPAGRERYHSTARPRPSSKETAGS